MNRPADAIASQRSALAISDRAATALPDHVEWQTTRALHRWQLARLQADKAGAIDPQHRQR
jgi:hypothetical protein